MKIVDQIQSLKGTLSPDSAILTDQNDAAFKEHMIRWSDIDREIPAAIVLTASEDDIQKTVQWAVQTSTPFVVKSGGHSLWSTIGGEGVIIDFSRYSSIHVDAEVRTAALRGSVLTKEVAVKLAEQGLFTALGNVNSVGVVGYCLGGGASTTNSITGYGSDQILSARMVTSKGELIIVDEKLNTELLWAVRGAGHFFGVITELVIQAHPLSMLGNDKGVVWAGVFVFPLTRAEEVSNVMKILMDDDKYSTSGLMMIAARPPTRKPALVITAKLTGNPDDAKTAFKPLYDLNPIVANGAPVPIQNANDALDAHATKGDFRRFGIIGLHRFDVASFMKVVSLWHEMRAECPDTMNSAFNFKWESRLPKAPTVESALSYHHVRFWQNNLIWHTDPKNRAKVDEYNDKTYEIMRSGSEPKDYVDFITGTRTGPIANRYRGAERLGRLKALKKKWDPNGVFTRQFL